MPAKNQFQTSSFYANMNPLSLTLIFCALNSYINSSSNTCEIYYEYHLSKNCPKRLNKLKLMLVNHLLPCIYHLSIHKLNSIRVINYNGNCKNDFFMICFQKYSFTHFAGFETPQFSRKFYCWIGAQSVLFTWQTEAFGREWKSVNRFAARCVQGYFGKRKSHPSRYSWRRKAESPHTLILATSLTWRKNTAYADKMH